MEETVEHKKFNKKWIFAGVIALVLILSFIIVRVKVIPYIEHKKEYNANLGFFKKYHQYFKEYNDQSYKIDDYTITLKSALYSDKAKTGYCIFEVEKENGAVEANSHFYIEKEDGTKEFLFHDGQLITSFGDPENSIHVFMIASGSLQSYAERQGDKLIVYTEFDASSTGPEFEKGQVALYHKKEDSDGRYGFKLEDGAKGKSYEIDENTILSVSCLGVTIESDKKIGSAKVEVEEAGGDKKSIFELDSSADVKGSYGEGYEEDEGVEKYVYSYTFDEIFDIDTVKKIYMNGKEL